MRRLLFFVLMLAAVGAGTAWYLQREHATATTPSPAAAAPAPGVPVVAGTAQVGDVPIFLSGLGTVQAFNTVTVKARVDGQLEKIHFVEGQDVKAGDVLAQIDPRSLQAALAQAIANKASDEAKLANARLELNRASSLMSREFGTQQRVDTNQALVAQLQANIQADQALIDNARVQLGFTTIVAPISGRTGIRLVDQGNIVRAADQNGIVVITQLQPISVIFTLPQDSIDDIQAEMAKGPLKVTAYKRDDKTMLDEGTLVLIDNQIDTATGTARLKATFPNTRNQLWPGQFVSARLLVKVRPNAVTVPGPVVQRGPNGTYAYVIKPDMTAEVRPIKVAQIREGVALIDEGLSGGDRVVIDGQYKLRPGLKVDAAPAPAGAPAPSAAPKTH